MTAVVFTTDRSLIQRETAPGSGSFVTIPQCSKITPPVLSRKEVDINIHDQDAPVTLFGGGEKQSVSFELAWNPGNASHQQLFQDWKDKTERNYRIVHPDTGAATETFAAVVGKLDRGDLDAEGKILTLNVEMSCTTDSTFVW